MKRTYVVGIALASLLAVSSLAHAAPVPVEAPKDCANCSMSRAAYAASRMVVTYDDGTSAGVCSLFCALADMKKHAAKQVASLQVTDYPSKTLIDAKTAHWVLGGKLNGGMNKPPVWAFAKETDAQAFVAGHGGQIASFAQVREALEKPAVAAGNAAVPSK